MKLNFFKWEIQVKEKPVRYRLTFFIPELSPNPILTVPYKSKRAAIRQAVLEVDRYSLDYGYGEFYAEVYDEWRQKYVTRVYATVHTEVISKTVHFEQINL